MKADNDLSSNRNHPSATIPWEDRPENSISPIWRYSNNPIITREHVRSANSIFNSAVVPYGEGFAGVFRCDDKQLIMRLHTGFSNDGINWKISQDPIKFESDDKEIGVFEYGYDPRVVWIDDRYYVTWCTGYYGPTIGLAHTMDFKRFRQLENAFLPYNRNGVLFPRKINNRYAMLSRPSDTGHTPFGDIFYSESPDLQHWGNHRHVMSPTTGWQSTKVGAGPVPIETNEGWLLIYHGVWTSCNGFIYGVGVALLDLEKPWKVLHRSNEYLIYPREPYERVGDVPNVVFPCAALLDHDTGRIAIYYGGADTVTCLAFSRIDLLIDFAKNH